MELETQFQSDDDRAVSPVIGVILMVAITVILAAVIGTFVLGLGENVETNPSAGVTVNDSDFVTLNSLGPNTDGIYCDVNPDNNDINATNRTGGGIDCEGANSVVAYTYSGSGIPSGVNDGDIENEAAIRNLNE